MEMVATFGNKKAFTKNNNNKADENYDHIFLNGIFET